METIRTNTNAIIGFVLSLRGIVSGHFRLLLFIASFIFSLIFLVQINERGEKGRVYAIVGIVIDSIVFLILILALFLVALSVDY